VYHNLIISSYRSSGTPGLAQALSIDKLGYLGHGRPESSVDVWGFEVSPELSQKNIEKHKKNNQKTSKHHLFPLLERNQIPI